MLFRERTIAFLLIKNDNVKKIKIQILAFEKNCIYLYRRAYAVPSLRMRGWAGHYIM